MSAGFHYWCQAGCGELVIKDGKAYLTKPEAIVQQVKQVIVHTLHEDCEPEAASWI